ncbi:MAG: hypothetical protein AB8B69_05810, partial [Chitinophagales bacterium]
IGCEIPLLGGAGVGYGIFFINAETYNHRKSPNQFHYFQENPSNLAKFGFLLCIFQAIPLDRNIRPQILLKSKNL